MSRGIVGPLNFHPICRLSQWTWLAVTCSGYRASPGSDGFYAGMFQPRPLQIAKGRSASRAALLFFSWSNSFLRFAQAVLVCWSNSFTQHFVLRAVLRPRTTVLMNPNPKHVGAEARPTGGHAKHALAERSRQAAGVSGIKQIPARTLYIAEFAALRMASMLAP